jgi:class 3 adenylate cyclase
MIEVQIDRHRCIGAGNCITIAPTAFDWLKDEFLKAAVVDTSSVEEELLRQAMYSCPTQAIIVKEVEELLPWQLRSGQAQPVERVVKTFIFTDIVKSTNLVEAMGDDAWQMLIRWHDETLRAVVIAHQGEVIETTGDGFFLGFDSPDAAIACAVAIQRRLTEHRQTHGFAPQVRIGIHASDVNQVGRQFRGIGVHEAARICALGEGSEIVASLETAAGSRFPLSESRKVSLKGISEPIEVVSINWR